MIENSSNMSPESFDSTEQEVESSAQGSIFKTEMGRDGNLKTFRTKEEWEEYHNGLNQNNP